MKKDKKTSKKVAPKAKKTEVKMDKSKMMEYAKSAGKVLGLLLVLLLVDLFVQYLNNDYSIAIVNGQRVPRSEYVNNLETMYGAQVVDALVEEELVKQIGQQEGVEVDSEKIDESYGDIEVQLGGEEALNQALETNNMTSEQLKEQLESELILKEIIEPRLEYTDEDLGNFFEEHKELLYEDTSDVEFEDVRDEIEEYYIEQKTFEERDVVLSEFQEQSSIQINVPGVGEEDTGYGFFKATRNLISNFVSERNTN